MASGQCLCGGVRFRIEAPLPDVTICHCRLCRRQSTHVGAYTRAEPEHLAFDSDATLAWYRSSPRARRGFCSACGSQLFWKADQRSYTAVAAGCLDQPTGMKVRRHFCTDEKGDYYDISDGLPQV